MVRRTVQHKISLWVEHQTSQEVDRTEHNRCMMLKDIHRVVVDPTHLWVFRIL